MQLHDQVQVCVIGIWHLGAVTSACLADLGYIVVGVDSDATNVVHLKAGQPPLFEPGLEELLEKCLKTERLIYTTDLERAVKSSRYVLIAYDIPVNDLDEVDLSQLLTTAAQIGRCAADGTMILVSSQVPVGTCGLIKDTIKRENPLLDFDVACSPENLRLGHAIQRFMHPDRIVIGADNAATLDNLEAFFGVIDSPKVRMSLRSAEMTKHAINAFLATCISFANEIGNICDEVGADALSVAEGLGTEERIGAKLPLKPGLPFAGATLARDLKTLQSIGDRVGYQTYLLDGVLQVNNRQNEIVMRKLQKLCGPLDELTITVFGLTYKAGTSTLRRSAALEIIRDLERAGSRVKAYDPGVNVDEAKSLPGFEFCSDPYAAARMSHALVFMTDWPEFAGFDFTQFKRTMKTPVIIDMKNMLDGVQLLADGFIYSGVGRGNDSAIKR